MSILADDGTFDKQFLKDLIKIIIFMFLITHNPDYQKE